MRHLESFPVNPIVDVALDIPVGNIIAFGDAQNDIPMFKIAGYCVAMGNACAELKNIASDVTLSNDEDGIAVALAKLGM